eukprot:3494611-Karenia_brevis.AAC.1
MKEAWDAGASCKPCITEGAVQARVNNLRNGAQPGSSRCRNDFITCISMVPGGRTSLRAWCQLWADGLVPECVAEAVT